MTSRIGALLVSSLCTVAHLACGGGEDQPTEPDEPEPQVSTIEVSPESAQLNAFGATQDFEATAKDQNDNLISGVNFDWSVSPDSVGRATDNGTVTAEATGSASVEATTSGVTGTATLDVTQTVSKVEIDRDSALSATFDTSIALGASAYDQNDHEVTGATIDWSSRDTVVASVDSTGTVRFSDIEGRTHIVAKSSSFADSTVAAVDTGVATIAPSPDSVLLLTELSDDLNVSVYNIYGEELSVSLGWQSTDTNIATAEEIGARRAKITGTGVGQGSIRVQANDETTDIPVHVDDPEDGIYTHVSLGRSHACAVTQNNELDCWGSDADYQLGPAADSAHRQNCSYDRSCSTVGAPVVIDPLVKAIEAGYKHTCALSQGGDVYCWGENRYGQLGDGQTTSREEPMPVDSDREYTSLSAHNTYSCGLTTDDDVYCWGELDSVSIGYTPTKIEGGISFTSISGAAGAVCGLSTDSAAYCWGAGYYGKLGTGHLSHEALPAEIDSNRTFTSIATGFGHACALAETGEAYCWGLNNFHQLGTDTNEECDRLEDPQPCAKSPVPVDTDVRFQSLAAGEAHTCGLSSNNELYCWGYNGWGQIGDGTTATRDRPVQVANPINIERVRAGGDNTCVRDTNDQVWCWGQNSYGQIGKRDTTDALEPQKVLRWPR